MGLFSIAAKLRQGKSQSGDPGGRVLPPYDVMLTECLRKNNNKNRILLAEIGHLLDDTPDYYAITVRLKLLRDLVMWNLDGEMETICNYVVGRVPGNPVAVDLIKARRDACTGMAAASQAFFSRYIGRIWDDSMKRSFGEGFPAFAGALMNYTKEAEQNLYCMYLPPNVLAHTTFVKPGAANG